MACHVVHAEKHVRLLREKLPYREPGPDGDGLSGDLVQTRLALLPQILRPDACDVGPEAADPLGRVTVAAPRPPAEAVEPLEGDPRMPLVATLESQDLALLRFRAVARFVAELHAVLETVDWYRAVEGESEVAR